MNGVVVSSLPFEDSPVEMVERKGLGHPDTICDALAEQLSRNLCRHDLDRFGEVLHHNVDKALLCGVRPGSQDLGALFARGRQRVPLANDTSFGVGHAPLSDLEGLVLRIERQLSGRDRAAVDPAWAEDIKVMGFRHGRAVRITVACALIGRHLRAPDDYLAQKEAIRSTVSDTTARSAAAIA